MSDDRSPAPHPYAAPRDHWVVESPTRAVRTGEAGVAAFTIDEVARREPWGLALHPSRPEAITATCEGAVLVRWDLTGEPRPVELAAGGPDRWGPFGSTGAPTLAFSDLFHVRLRSWQRWGGDADWAGADLRPGRAKLAVSPDGRLVAAGAAEVLWVVDVATGRAVEAPDDPADVERLGYGTWGNTPVFAPDGRSLAVASYHQYHWWLTVLEIGPDGAPVERFQRFLSDEDPVLPAANATDVAFAPDGGRIALLVQPEHLDPGDPPAMAVAVDPEDGAVLWRRPLAFRRGRADPPSKHLRTGHLCFDGTGGRIAVGLGDEVWWLDATTGVPLERTETALVHGLATQPGTGAVYAATDAGLRRL
jgi:hypothetical protein